MRRLTVQLAVLAMVATLAVVAPSPPAGAAPTLPSGFTDELVAMVDSPTAVAFLPDGRLLVTTQPGQLRVIQNDALVAGNALDLSGKLCSNSERGLLGVAVDPAFATTGNNWIYLYYTFRKSGTTCPMGSASVVNRVARFRFDTATNTADPNTEQVLVDNVASWGGNHNAGDLQFGKDGMLYVSIGDGGTDYDGSGGNAGTNNASRDQFKLLGKILRITRTGGVPSDNPFLTANDDVCALNGGTSNTTHRCRETFAWGLRNPFRIAFNPNASGTEFHINDVGQNLWEEIDRGASGVDYGWNVREGFCANGSSTNCRAPGTVGDPIFAYGGPNRSCASITGGAFVPDNAWPAPYSGSYLFADYVCGKIFRLVDNGNGTFSSADFVSELGISSATSLTFGPSPSGTSLYYTSYFNGGAVHRINSTTGNRAPSATVSGNPTSGPLPLRVSFSGAGSSDPDGDAITYQWNFGDGASANTGATNNVTHDYTVAGTYTASLTVQDANGASSQPATVTIRAGNRAPTPSITSPSTDTVFKVGSSYTFKGSATDPEDGSLGGSRTSWTIIKRHDTHTHPFLGPVTGSSVTFQAPAPDDLLAATNSYLEVQLTATDSAGLSTTVTRDFLPRKVNLTFATAPSGLSLEVGGTPISAPQTFVSWTGYGIEVFAPSPQNGLRWYKWTDGGGQRHTYVTGGRDKTLTAKFRA